jgi:hypothetical protein
MRNMLGPLVDTGGLCGKEWLLEHGMDVTMEDIENQKLEVISPNHKTTINAKLKSKIFALFLSQRWQTGAISLIQSYRIAPLPRRRARHQTVRIKCA